MKDLITKDNICCFFCGISLVICILCQYSTEVACALGGALGGAIAVKGKDKIDTK